MRLRFASAAVAIAMLLTQSNFSRADYIYSALTGDVLTRLDLSTNQNVRVGNTGIFIGPIGRPSDPEPNMAYSYFDDKLFYVDGDISERSRLFTLNRNTAARTLIGNTAAPYTLTGLDFDYSTNTLYSIGNSNRLVSLNQTTGAGTLVATIDRNISEIAYDSSRNRLVGLSGNSFYEINRTTGETSFLALFATVSDLRNATYLTYDWNRDLFIRTVKFEENRYYTYSPTNGYNETLVNFTGESLSQKGLAFTADNAPQLQPQPVPAPAGLVLAGIGMAALAVRKRFKK
jgi:hypothetical protein